MRPPRDTSPFRNLANHQTAYFGQAAINRMVECNSQLAETCYAVAVEDWPDWLGPFDDEENIWVECEV